MATNGPSMPAGPSDDGSAYLWRHGRLVAPEADALERTVGVLMHLWWAAIPALGPFALAMPLALWAAFQSRSGFLDDHGREALNVQCTLLILCLVPVCGWIPLVPWLPVWLVASVPAAIAAGRGAFFRYPMAFRILR